MKTSHKGLGISQDDWSAFAGHLGATLKVLKLPKAERDDVLAMVQSTKDDMVEA